MEDYEKMALLEALKKKRSDTLEGQSKFPTQLQELKQSPVDKREASELFQSSKRTDDINKLTSAEEFTKKQQAVKVQDAAKRLSKSAEKASKVGDQVAKKRSLEALRKLMDKSKNLDLEDAFKAGLKTSSTLKSAGSKGLKMIPVIGPMLGAASALYSGDAAASVGDLVVPGGLEGVGPAKGSPESIIEDPSASPEERKAAMNLLMKRQALQNKLGGN